MNNSPKNKKILSSFSENRVIVNTCLVFFFLRNVCYFCLCYKLGPIILKLHKGHKGSVKVILHVPWLNAITQVPMGFDVTNMLPYLIWGSEYVSSSMFWFDLWINNYLYLLYSSYKVNQKTWMKVLWFTFTLPFWSVTFLDPIDFHCEILQISSFILRRRKKVKPCWNDMTESFLPLSVRFAIWSTAT